MKKNIYGIFLLFTPLLLSFTIFEAYAQDTTGVKQDSIQTDHFIPVSDRWRDIQPPPYELNVEDKIYDPYNRNVLKGDYPIIGQDIFFVLQATADNLFELATAPTPSGISTENAVSPGFFGDESRLISNNNFKFTLELYRGDAAFKPRDWEIKVTPVINFNYVSLKENNNLNINPAKGPTRSDNHIAFQELSFEKHLFDLSPRYDFVSFRGGIQKLNSDFRAFIFEDYNLGARLLGSAGSNRYQYNLAYFKMLEKDTNSELNTVFEDREQDVFVANLYKQDFLTLGYTGQLSFHYNHDKPSTYYDHNGVPVRPAILGDIREHDIKSYYIGWAGDGHFGRLNVNHAFYQVLGQDSFNSLAGKEVDINAQMAALELSVDVDWKRYKISAFYASGDSEPADATAKGFDTIIDLPFFAGGPFSYWNSQPIRLQGVNLVQKLSLVPNLRSNKFEGQSNFVNPGLLLVNVGMDAELTPKLKAVFNANYLRFAATESLENFTNQNNIDDNIGIDTSLGFIYRPFLNNNAIIALAGSALTPLGGFEDLYETSKTRFAFLTSLILTY